jgi:hypothetical protein
MREPLRKVTVNLAARTIENAERVTGDPALILAEP